MALNHWGDQSYVVTTHWDAYTLNVPFTNSAPVNAWYHWTVVMDNVGMYFYLNGQLFGSREGVSTTYVAGTQLGLGTISGPYGAVPYTDSNVGYLDGCLDDVRIYNRALSPAEVLAIYATDGGGGGDISPFFTLHPVTQVISPGQQCVFSADASGTPEPAFQWRFQGENIAGATNRTYSISSAGISAVGWYDVVASNRAGTAISTPASLSFCALKMLSAVFLDGPVGSTYLIEAADVLQPLSWYTVTNITVTTQPFVYIDYSSATNSKCFYRAVPQ